MKRLKRSSRVGGGKKIQQVNESERCNTRDSITHHFIRVLRERRSVMCYNCRSLDRKRHTSFSSSFLLCIIVKKEKRERKVVSYHSLVCTLLFSVSRCPSSLPMFSLFHSLSLCSFYFPSFWKKSFISLLFPACFSFYLSPFFISRPLFVEFCSNFILLALE